MGVLLFVSPAPLVGKTAVAVGLAHHLVSQGHRLSLLRLASAEGASTSGGGDEGAAADAHLFATLPFNAQRHRHPLTLEEAATAAAGVHLALVEAPAGDAIDAVGALNARAVPVLPYARMGEEASLPFCRALGGSLLGVVVSAVPRRRLDAARHLLGQAGLKVLALIPEDRTLSSPTIAELAQALAAQTMFLDDQGQPGAGLAGQVLDRILIASISADPGQGYFARYNPNAVIVRSDKPDLQLAALNAGVRCLIVTSAGGGSLPAGRHGALGGGGLPPLSYVLQRAEEEGVPLLLTEHDTGATLSILEGLYPRTRFAGQAKLQRIGQLLDEALDRQALKAITGGE